MSWLWWAIPGLNTRETALVAWVGGFIAYQVVTRSEVRRSVAAPLKLIFGSWLLGGVIAASAGYAALLAYLLRWVGFWDHEMLKLTVVWFLGAGLVAVFSTAEVDGRYWRRLILHSLTLTAVIEFITNLHTLPLLVELVLVPVALMLAMTEAFTAGNPEYAPAHRLFGWCLGLLGTAVLSYSLAHLATHAGHVVTVEKFEEFALPLVLTVCFLSFLFGVRLFSVYQTTLHMTRFGLADDGGPLYRFTRRSIIAACGLSLRRAQLFESRFRGRLLEASTEAEVSQVLADFRRACQPQPGR